MTTFTREQLETLIECRKTSPHYCNTDPADLAAFALALLDRAETAEAERDEANDERDDAVDRWARRAREAEAELDASEKEAKMYAARALAAEERQEKAEAERDSFRLEADRLREKLREAEKRMKAWGCPDFDFICLNCGRETPCITEADLRPGDPGVPCTFDLTYPQMIERLHYHEDKQRKAEAERDRLRKELRDAEEAIRSIVKLVLRVKTGEPREAIWSLLKSFESVASNTPAVRRARERAGRG